MSLSNHSRRTGAVIVGFHPDPAQLNTLIAALRSQVRTIVIVDNSTPPLVSPDWPETDIQVTWVRPGRNIGVAAAINLGVHALIESDHDCAALFDQDSLPPGNMIAALNGRLDQLVADGRRVAAIGPMIRERGSRQPAPFVRFRLPMNQRLRQGHGSLACDFLITSGKLLNLVHWDAIGPMREDWFIDNIDLEWSFRARRLGFELHGCFDTELAHSIGQRQRLFRRLPWPCYRHHGPERLYTMMRNRVLLYRANAPRAWIIQDSLRAIGKLVLFSLIRPRRENLRAMLRGLRDGIRGKLTVDS